MRPVSHPLKLTYPNIVETPSQTPYYWRVVVDPRIEQPFRSDEFSTAGEEGITSFPSLQTLKMTSHLHVSLVVPIHHPPKPPPSTLLERL